MKNSQFKFWVHVTYVFWQSITAKQLSHYNINKSGLNMLGDSPVFSTMITLRTGMKISMQFAYFLLKTSLLLLICVLCWNTIVQQRISKAHLILTISAVISDGNNLPTCAEKCFFHSMHSKWRLFVDDGAGSIAPACLTALYFLTNSDITLIEMNE